MSEELQKRMMDYLDSLESTVQQGSGFLVEQAPLVCQEYVDWVFWSGVLLAVPCAACAILLFAFAAWAARKAIKSKEADSQWWLAMALLVLFGLTIGVPSVLGVGDAVKASVAPRVVVLEKLAELSRAVR